MSTALGDGGLDGSGETHFPILAFEERGLAADDDELAHFAAERANEAQDADGIHAVAVGRGGGLAVERREIGLDEIERAGRATARNGVDEDGVALVHERVGEIVAANAEVVNLDAVGDAVAQEFARDFAAEGVVAEENVADAGD